MRLLLATAALISPALALAQTAPANTLNVTTTLVQVPTLRTQLANSTTEFQKHLDLESGFHSVLDLR
jgi:hypothetical protein